MNRSLAATISALLLACAGAASLAAQMPSTDVWLVGLERAGDSWSVGTPRNLTARDGYDNQPAFAADGGLVYFTSSRDGQTDIWVVDLATGAARAATSTPESEYSPTVVPGGGALSVVRVESDGTQRLWRLPLDGSAPKVLAAEVRGVGYHAWLNAETVAVFLLGEPMTLEVIGLADGSRRKVVDSPGRSLHRLPDTTRLSYVAADGEGFALFAFDPAAGDSTRLGPAPDSEAHDYAWTPDAVAVAAVGSKLVRMKPGSDAAWLEIADLASHGIGTITRLAISPAGDSIAFVVDR